MTVIPIRDAPATPELATELYALIGLAVVRMIVDTMRPLGVEITVKLAEKSLREHSSDLGHG